MAATDVRRCADAYFRAWKAALAKYYRELEDSVKRLGDNDIAKQALAKAITDALAPALEAQAEAYEACEQLGFDRQEECKDRADEAYRREWQRVQAAFRAQGEQLAKRESDQLDRRANLASTFRASVRAALVARHACLGAATRTVGSFAIPILGTPVDVFPDVVYIASKQASHDAPDRVFLDDAESFHREWELRVEIVDSLEDVVASLARDVTSDIRRVRLVCHADDRGLWFPIFTGGFPQTTADTLTKAAVDDLALLKIYMGVAGLDVMKAAARSVEDLAPGSPAFRALDLAHPTADVAEFVVWRRKQIELAAKKLRFPEWITGSPSHSSAFASNWSAALDVLVQLSERRLVAGGVAAVTLAALSSDLTAAVNRKRPFVLRLTGKRKDLPGHVANLESATTALAAEWRKNLDVVRAALRTTGASVDVRGCLLNRGVLKAIATFFDVDPRNVTGSNWFQAWPRVTETRPISEECERDAFKRAAARASVQRWLPRWATELGIDSVAIGHWSSRPPVVRWKAMAAHEKLQTYLWFTLVLPTAELTGGGRGTVRVWLDYRYDCVWRDTTEAMEIFLQNVWCDAPVAVLNKLVQRWSDAAAPLAPRVPLLADEQEAGGKTAFPSNVDYAKHIIAARA